MSDQNHPEQADDAKAEHYRRVAEERGEPPTKHDALTPEQAFNLEWQRMNVPEGVRRERQAKDGHLPTQNASSSHAAGERAALERKQQQTTTPSEKKASPKKTTPD